MKKTVILLDTREQVHGLLEMKLSTFFSETLLTFDKFITIFTFVSSFTSTMHSDGSNFNTHFKKYFLIILHYLKKSESNYIHCK